MKKHFLFIFLAFITTVYAQMPAKFTSNTILDMMNISAPPSSAKAKKAFTPGEKITAYLKYNNESCIDTLKQLGITIRTVTPNVITAVIPVSAMEEAANLQGIDCIQTSQTVKFQMDSARVATRVDDVQAAKDPIETPFLGKGVLVGVIDGGVDFTHPDFYTSDRETLRIKRVWVQGDNSGTAPENFGYGSEYKTPESITTKGTDYSYFSHGSHVMGIAAGADTINNPYYGVAREADLAFSTFESIDAGITDAIKYIYDYADEQEIPAVINMSLGTEMGPHDGTSLRDIMADEMAGEGRILVGAAGNNGLVDMHISKTFTLEDDTLFAGVAFLEGFSGVGEIQVWGDEGKSFKINVCTVDKETMRPVYKSRTFDASKSFSGSITLQKPFDQSSGFFSIVTQTSPLNNKPMAHLQLGIDEYKPNKVIGLIIIGEPGTTVHAWANENYCCFKQFLPNMDIPDNKFGVCEIGGTGKKIITVASYSTKTEIKALNGDVINSGFPIYDIAPYSNHGPSTDGRMKPDIAAPGSYIISAFNSFESNNISRVSKGTWNGKDYFYGVYQGTSMASPHVAGIIATWLQAYPKLTPDMIREVLSETAVKDAYTGDDNNNTWGYGKIDAYNGLVYILKKYTSQTDIISKNINNSWIGNRINNKLHILYFKPTPATYVNVYTDKGILVLSETVKNKACGDEYILDLSDKEKGLYLVTVISADKKETFKYLNNK